MKSHLIARCLMTLSMLGPGFVRAQGLGPGVEAPPGPSLNRFSVSYRAGFNITADFKNVGRFPALGHSVFGQGQQPAAPGPATGGGINRTYEDGYNWVDSTGNTFGLTRYWGYDYGDNNSSASHPTQHQGDSIVMHSTSSAGVSSKDRDDDPVHGFEISYNRELSRDGQVRVGLEAAFGYSPLNIHDGRPLSGTANRITDAFALPSVPGGGVVNPPSAPYDGSFELRQPGQPVISDSPTRTSLTVAESISGARRLSSDLFGFRLGPYAEFALSPKVSFTLSGGFALVYALGDFSFDQTVSIPGAGLGTLSGSTSRDKLLPGGFVAGNFSVALSESWRVFAGAQFQDVGDYVLTHKASGQQAVLDLSQSIFVAVGVSWSF